MQETVYFGTYTKKSSQGIYQAYLDTEKKTLTTPKIVLKTGNPTYLQVTKDKILAIASRQDLGGIEIYRKADGTLLDEALTPGPNPCYVAYDAKRQLVYTANYHKAEVNVYAIDEDGKLNLTDSFQSDGQGPRPEQEKSHLHYADLTPDGRLVVIDLGSDRVFTFDVSASGKLDLVATYQTEAGFGPRHLVFHPNGKFAYLAGELSSQVQTLAYDTHTGHFRQVQTLPTIPADWTAHNGVAAIHISADGKFVYLSNRGHNSLAVFAVDAHNELTLIQHITTAGDFPRDFDLDPSQNFIICTNQNSDNATLYARNVVSGKLTLLQKDLLLPEGVCVKFDA